MGYWQAKSDLTFIRNFKETAVEFLNADSDRLRIKKGEFHREFGDFHGNLNPEATEALERFDSEYSRLRQLYVKSMARATGLADRYAVPSVLSLSPPPAIGGFVRNVNVYQAVIEELPWGARMSHQRIMDIIHQTEGACEKQLGVERRHLYNPFYWLVEALTFVLRVPFLLFQASGFHIEKFEDQLWGRFFKFLELVALIGFLWWLGASKPDIRNVLARYLHIDIQMTPSTIQPTQKTLPNVELPANQAKQ